MCNQRNPVRCHDSMPILLCPFTSSTPFPSSHHTSLYFHRSRHKTWGGALSHNVNSTSQPLIATIQCQFYFVPHITIPSHSSHHASLKYHRRRRHNTRRVIIVLKQRLGERVAADHNVHVTSALGDQRHHVAALHLFDLPLVYLEGDKNK